MTKPLKLIGKPSRVLSERQVERLLSRPVATLHLDYETYCDLDLRKVGLDVYSDHPSCRVLMAAYRIDGGPLKQWFPHLESMPAELRRALRNSKVRKWAFNAQFERVITRRVLKIKTPRANWRCTQALAYMHCFAGTLEQVGAAMGIPSDAQKKKTGTKLIKIFCMPNKPTKNQPHVYRNWDTDPDLWEEFAEYNAQDVVAEEAILTRLNKKAYPVPEEEWELYELDQLINDRGIPVDMRFVDNIIWMSIRRKKELHDEMRELSDNRIVNPGSRNQLLKWLKANEYPHLDLRADSVKKTLASVDEKELILPKRTVKMLRLRQWASMTSVTKARTAKLVVGRGDRFRYGLQFGGASRTLRWAGRKVQTQNMKRTPKVLEAEESAEKLALVTDLIRNGKYDSLEMMVGEPMLALSGCMRSMFRTEKNMEFKTGDYSSIESAVIAWVTGCKRLLKVFRDGRDPYKDFGIEFFRIAYELIEKWQRNLCKPPALGCGFRLGPGKILPNGKKTGLLGYAENMGVKMTLKQAIRAVKIYREIYSEIPEHWKAYETAIRKCMRTGRDVDVGPVTFELRKPYLCIRLPSNRRIYYFRPKLQNRTIKTGEFHNVYDRETGRRKRVEKTWTRLTFTHMGRDNAPGASNKWKRVESHGGVVIENIVQAVARDVLAVGMRRAHKVGYRLVGHAHDELIAEQRKSDNEFTWQRMCDIMKEPIEWAAGLPLGAAGWQEAFYRK